MHRCQPWALLVTAAVTGFSNTAWAAEPLIVDLDTNAVGRVSGSAGNGSFGLPVAGGFDINADGNNDVAFGAMTASPMGRNRAGTVYLAFGDGTTQLSLDTGTPEVGSILEIFGSALQENAGSEVWMDDIDGDGVGDLLICRQNFTPEGSRAGAGAVTVLFGSAILSTLASIDLASPPVGVDVLTIVGPNALDRLGIWVRAGDIDGDGIADLVMGADQQDGGGETRRGAVYVLRGSASLKGVGTIDLSTPNPGVDLLHIIPPPNSDGFHFGATCAVADLDGDGRGELLAAATLFRGGAQLEAAGQPSVTARAIGGPPGGRFYIYWGDAIPTPPWSPTPALAIGTGNDFSTISGGSDNERFGEELIGGLDYNGDGAADLFVGDLTGDLSPGGGRNLGGAGTLFFNAAQLRGQNFDMNSIPGGIQVTEFAGGAAGDLGADTAFHGDFDGDGIADIGFSSPDADPLGRIDAGIVYLFFGHTGTWFPYIDLSDLGVLDAAPDVRWSVAFGANGGNGSNRGDTLSYSAMAGDIDGDGRTDLITNEMRGDGTTPADVDRGNLVIIGANLFAPRADDPPPNPPGPPENRGCAASPATPWAWLLALAFTRGRRRRRPPGLR